MVRYCATSGVFWSWRRTFSLFSSCIVRGRLLFLQKLGVTRSLGFSVVDEVISFYRLVFFDTEGLASCP